MIAGPRPGNDNRDRYAVRMYSKEQLSRSAERQRIMDTLSDTLARHEALFTSASEGIVTVNESNTIERVNPAAAAMFGHRAEELERRNFAILLDDAAEPGG